MPIQPKANSLQHFVGRAEFSVESVIELTSSPYSENCVWRWCFDAILTRALEPHYIRDIYPQDSSESLCPACFSNVKT